MRTFDESAFRVRARTKRGARRGLWPGDHPVAATGQNLAALAPASHARRQFAVVARLVLCAEARAAGVFLAAASASKRQPPPGLVVEPDA